MNVSNLCDRDIMLVVSPFLAIMDTQAKELNKNFTGFSHENSCLSVILQQR